MSSGGRRERSDITVTRVERIIESKMYKCGDLFTAANMAQNVPISANDLRVIFAQRKDLFERVEGHGGQPTRWRSRKSSINVLKMHLRTEYGFGEEEYTPKYY